MKRRVPFSPAREGAGLGRRMTIRLAEHQGRGRQPDMNPRAHARTVGQVVLQLFQQQVADPQSANGRVGQAAAQVCAARRFIVQDRGRGSDTNSGQ